MTKLGGVAAQKPVERLGVLERQHRRHPAEQVLLEIGLVPADGDGYAGQGEVVLAEEGFESGSVLVVGHGDIR